MCIREVCVKLQNPPSSPMQVLVNKGVWLNNSPVSHAGDSEQRWKAWVADYRTYPVTTVDQHLQQSHCVGVLLHAVAVVGAPLGHEGQPAASSIDQRPLKALQLTVQIRVVGSVHARVTIGVQRVELSTQMHVTRDCCNSSSRSIMLNSFGDNRNIIYINVNRYLRNC